MRKCQFFLNLAPNEKRSRVIKLIESIRKTVVNLERQEYFQNPHLTKYILCLIFFTQSSTQFTFKEKMKPKRFHQLRQKIDDAFKNNHIDLAEKLAKEYLTLAEENTSDWNYGNAIHHGNLILGRISLINGKKEEAKNFLIRAGSTPGSPQLNSFGPNMQLAKELLESGETQIVLEYLDLCEKFWNKLVSWWKLRKWRRKIQYGKTPNFGANLHY